MTGRSLLRVNWHGVVFVVVDAEVWGQAVIAAGGVISAAVPLLAHRSNRKTLRDNVARDIAALKELPQDHTARASYDQLIEEQVQLMRRELDARRDPFGIGLGIGFILAGILGGIYVLQIGASGWWLVAVVTAFILGSAGLAQDVSRTKRDAKGRPIS